jgi:hypothetical protein
LQVKNTQKNVSFFFIFFFFFEKKKKKAEICTGLKYKNQKKRFFSKKKKSKNVEISKTVKNAQNKRKPIVKILQKRAKTRKTVKFHFFFLKKKIKKCDFCAP